MFCKYCKEKAHEAITVYDDYKVKQTINYSEIRCHAPGCEKNFKMMKIIFINA